VHRGSHEEKDYQGWCGGDARRTKRGVARSLLRVKMVGKILGNTGFVFLYFLVIFILFGKYGNR
jgi:hypothetical protein